MICGNLLTVRQKKNGLKKSDWGDLTKNLYEKIN
jgi:hypothetical protein